MNTKSCFDGFSDVFFIALITVEKTVISLARKSILPA